MDDSPMMYDGDGADDRLGRLGVRREDLLQALAGADVEAARYQSDDDAKNASGLVRWARTVGLLRRRLRQRGWTTEDPQNLPLVIDPSGCLSIITTTGDSATGYPYDTPKTQYSKGSATKITIDTDTDVQLSIMNLLHDEISEEMSRVVATEDEHREVWCLLRAGWCVPTDPLPACDDKRWFVRVVLDHGATERRGSQ